MSYFAPVAIIATGVLVMGGFVYMSKRNRQAVFREKYNAVMPEAIREATSGVIADENVTRNLNRALLNRDYVYSPNREGSVT